jgi:hypothetical protein
VVRASNSKTQTVSYDWAGLRLGGQGPGPSIRTIEWIDLRITGLYRRSTGAYSILQVSTFLTGLFGCCFCFAYCHQRRYSFACTLALPTLFVLTIVHSDGTSILSLHSNSYNRLDRLIFLKVSLNHILSSSYKVVFLISICYNCKLRLVIKFKYSICFI